MERPARENRPAGTGDDRVPDLLDTIAASRIYFGHQSVGANVLEGLREITPAGTTFPIDIVHGRDADASHGPALVEFTIGVNGNPISKLDDFASALDARRVKTRGLALFKYCYLDITPHTDVARLFEAHRHGVRAMQVRHPELTFVHVTAPLTRSDAVARQLVKRVLGKPTSLAANRRRNEFNALVRREFRGEPIFDLARVEAGRSVGDHPDSVGAGSASDSLAAALTDDGGHLNAAGRRAAAHELLRVLAQLRVPS
jgi:hypothetical protein